MGTETRDAWRVSGQAQKPYLTLNIADTTRDP